MDYAIEFESDNSKDDGRVKVQDIANFKNQVKKDGEHLVLETFPHNIIKIKSLLDTEEFNWRNISIFKQNVKIEVPATQSKSSEEKSDKSGANATQSSSIGAETLGLEKRTFLFSSVSEPSNTQIIRMIDIIKPLMMHFGDEMRLLKFALTLMVPQVEDGNNFGVEIQQEVITSIVAAQIHSLLRFNQISEYFSQRAKTVTQIAKYPHISDMRESLKEEDEKFRLVLCLIVEELRDFYAKIHDLILKNIEKIKNPRSNCEMNTY